MAARIFAHQIRFRRSSRSNGSSSGLEWTPAGHRPAGLSLPEETMRSSSSLIVLQRSRLRVRADHAQYDRRRSHTPLQDGMGMVAHADGHSNRLRTRLRSVLRRGQARDCRDDQGCHDVPIRLLYGRWASGGGCRREPLVRERKPLRQQPRRLGRRLTVERHHGGRHAGPAAQLRTPPVADGRHLDLVRAPANGLFEAMNGHVCDASRGEASDDSTLRGDAIKRSATRRARPQREAREIVRATRGKIFRCQVVHRFCTCHPQDFHR